ncbi:P-loop NTPase fold protein [Serratia sp. CY74008]|uniref:KAP family P-loop NTPase fold protein n=1 Tax=Serratia sp. CY74008 TaxID=3383674 RepID=UPI003F9EC84B
MEKHNFELNWDWSKEDGSFFDGEYSLLTIDKLERRRYAEYLYFYLKEKGVENNTVINLNAEWGAGKTFFIRRMYHSIEDIHPCIYIDAWKQDYSDDAFLTLFSSLINQIEKYSGKLDANLQKTLMSIGRFTKGVIPEILSSVINKYTGIESVGDIAKSAAQLMLSEHKEKADAINELRKELSFWARLSFDKGFKPPVFIFIDELDRCRPNYAINLLEIVKHIFNIDKFVFIIATDTNQLQHSIKNIYGNDFGANDYLGRFFHRRFSLKAPDVNLLIKERIIEELQEEFEELTKNLIPRPTSAEQLSSNISEVFKVYELNLRDSIRNTDRLIDLLKAHSFKKKIDYLALMMLMVMYDKDYNLMQIITGKISNTTTIDKEILGRKNLKGFGISHLNLILDCSSKNIGLNYYWNGHQTRAHNSLGIENIAIYSREYLDKFAYFIAMYPSVRKRIKDEGHNPLFKFSNELSDNDKVMIHRGALLELNPDEGIYAFEAYSNFIELSSSFE